MKGTIQKTAKRSSAERPKRPRRQEQAGPGAPKGNKNAAKPAAERLESGRLTLNLGQLKGQAEQAAKAQGVTLSEFIRRAIKEAL